MSNKRVQLKKCLLVMLFVTISLLFQGLIFKTDTVKAADPATNPLTTIPVTPAPGTTTTPTPAPATTTPAATPAATPKGSVSVGLPFKPGTTSYSQWNVYLSDFFTYAEIVGVSLAVLMIVWAGYLYMFSAGDSTKMNSAKEYIMGAIIGLIILYMINYLSALLGICNVGMTKC